MWYTVNWMTLTGKWELILSYELIERLVLSIEMLVRVDNFLGCRVFCKAERIEVSRKRY